MSITPEEIAMLKEACEKAQSSGWKWLPPGVKAPQITLETLTFYDLARTWIPKLLEEIEQYQYEQIE